MRRAALIGLLALAGCGGGDDDDTRSEPATALLDRGFATDVDTGFMTLHAEIELDGGPLDGRFGLQLEGAFRGTGNPTQMPDLDLAFRVSGGRREYQGRAIVTRANAWVEHEGEAYEVGQELWSGMLAALERQSSRTFAEAGIDPLDWVTKAEEDGTDRVSGTRATKVTGMLDAEAMLRDLNELSGGEAIPEAAGGELDDAVGDVELEAWIGEDDIWRRVTAATEFRVPREERDSAGGLESGDISLDVELDGPNEPVEIEGPADARPLDELLRRLGIPPEQLLGPGFEAPTPG